MIGLLTLYEDLQELFVGQLNERSVGDRSILDGLNPVVSGRKHFQYLWGHPNFCNPDPSRPVIYFHNLRTGQEYSNMGKFSVPCQITIGIYRVCGKGHQYFEQMRSTLKRFFGSQTWMINEFDCTFKSVAYTSVTLADFGFSGVLSDGDVEVPDTCGCVLWECTVSFNLKFERKLTF